MKKLTGLYLLDQHAFELVYPPSIRQQIEEFVEMVAEPQTAASIAQRPELLADVDVILSGWGMPRFGAAMLARAPKLRAIFYAAGAVGGWMSDAVRERGVVVSSAQEANAVPVAEYTFATILFSLKHGWQLARQTREQRSFPSRDHAPGCYGSTVGLISLGAIARRLLPKLATTDLKVIAYDPFLSDDEARSLNIERVGLDELFARADVVSLHTPVLPETRGLIRGEHFASMKPGATFINTARGAVVRESEMIQVLTSRPDLQAILDVTDPEPPVVDSPLYTLPNVLLTPHIAGSAGAECQRMGMYMVEELRRFVRGEALQWEVTPQKAALSSHRPIGKPASHAPAAAPKIAAVGG